MTEKAPEYKVFTYDYLLATIIDYSNSKNKIDERVEKVAQWKLESNESFMMSMLINRHDFIAA